MNIITKYSSKVTLSFCMQITEDGRLFDDGMNKKMALTATTLQGLQHRLDNMVCLAL